jgi:hypothetical protein
MSVRSIVEYLPAKNKDDLPVLRLYVHGAPHRRMHRAILAQYRKELYAETKKLSIKLPIKTPIEVNVTFINPTGPDIGNLYLALEQALDGKCGQGPTVLADDSLICYVKAGVLFTEFKK